MKRKKAALYDPYLDTLGGGERHIIYMLKILHDKGYHIDIFWNHDLSADIKQTFGIDLKNVTFKPNVFRSKGGIVHKLDMLRNYEYFFYITDGSFFFSSAKKNYIYAMIPDKKLYYPSFANKMKTFNYKYICNSKFTKAYLNSIGIEAEICYPPINASFLAIEVEKLKKEPIVLSVGRFFAHLHSKRHDIAIEAFNRLQKKYTKFGNYKLYIAGGLKKEDEGYFQTLKELAADNKNIIFAPNIPSKDLFELYKKSSIYWHCTGFGQDEKISPEKVEHLGFTPVEAMAAGAIPICFRAGGLKEVIEEGKNGYLFGDIDELIEKTVRVAGDKKEQVRLKKNARTFAETYFSYAAFEKRMWELL